MSDTRVLKWCFASRFARPHFAVCALLRLLHADTRPRRAAPSKRTTTVVNQQNRVFPSLNATKTPELRGTRPPSAGCFENNKEISGKLQLPCQCCLVDDLGGFAVGTQMRGLSLFPLVP